MTNWMPLRARTIGMALALAGLCFWQGALAQQERPPEPIASALEVNINEADAETIADVLDGVGLTKAQAIVEYREAHGPYRELRQLMEVKGIGEATLAKNSERIRFE